MPSIEEYKKQRPAYAVCLIGPAGSGKTEQGCGFPKTYYIGTDPTGLDTVFYQERTAKLVDNLVQVEVLNGLPLDEVFANDESSLSSIFGNIAYATKLAEQGKVRTIFLDNLTYLVSMKWEHLGGDNNRNTQQAYGQLAQFASDLMLSRLLPLAARNRINIVTAIHVQRESNEYVKGADEYNTAGKRKGDELGRSKRQVNLNRDLSPMILGGFRQAVNGMPSAMIYLNNETAGVDASGKPLLKYLAYTQKQAVKIWDTEIEAKNRYGLPPILDLTNASLYATLVQASKKAMAARPDAKAASATPTTPVEQQPTQTALDAQKETKS